MDSVETRAEMWNLMKRKVLPMNYQTDFFINFKILNKATSQWLSIGGIFPIAHKVCLGQVKDVADCRYHYGLRLDIHLLAFQNFGTVDEVVQHALKAEKITVHQAHKLTSYKGISQLSLSPRTSTHIESSQEIASSFRSNNESRKEKNNSHVLIVITAEKEVACNFNAHNDLPKASVHVIEEQGVEGHDEPESELLTIETKEEN